MKTGAPEAVSEEAPARKAIAARDLLSIGPVRRFLTSPYYPGLFQAASVVIFALVVFFAFFGTIRPGRNFATVVTWTLWWPLLPLSLLLAGRAWCSVCPLLPPMGLAQRLAQPARTPGLFLRRYSVWIMGLSFFFLTLTDRVWGFTISPRATGWLVVVLLALGLAMAVRYRGRAFCRHLCPIGALTGLYAMTALAELRGRGGACQGCPQLCYRGNQGKGACPLYEFPRTMDNNRNCNFCANCLKTCPQDNLGLRLRLPGQELWSLRRPLVGEALLAALLVALVFIQTLDMTTAWGSYAKWMIEALGLRSYIQVLTITFIGGAVVLVGAYLAASWLSSRGGPWRRNLASYGYAFIPLALAGHLGHNTGHLLYEGPTALRTALSSLASLVGITYTVNYSATGSSAFRMSWIAGLVALGAGFSLWLIWRQGRAMKERGEPSRAFPHLALVAAVAALFIVLFLLPMNPRHSH